MWPPSGIQDNSCPWKTEMKCIKSKNLKRQEKWGNVKESAKGEEERRDGQRGQVAMHNVAS